MRSRIKCKPLFLAFCLIAVSLLCGAQSARAADSDFDVSYVIYPDLVGNLGADMDLVLTVSNTGTTNITKVQTGIDTAGGYSHTWNGTILPGHGVGIRLAVPFMAGDVDETRTMTVRMNNDGDAATDGTKTFHFTVHSTDNVFTNSSVISPPGGGPYDPGDTIIITMRYLYNMTGDNAYNVVTSASLTTEDGTVLHNFPDDDQGTVIPEKYAVSSYTYTLRAAEAGRVYIRYRLRAEIFGRDYNLSGTTQYFDVTGASPTATPASTSPHSPSHSPGASALSTPGPADVPSGSEKSGFDFTAGIYAKPVEINAGDTVYFKIEMSNTGAEDIDGFEIRNADGALEAEAEGIAAGGERFAVVTGEYAETCDVSFTVIGHAGDISVSKETDPVHISVLGGAGTASAASAAQSLPAAASSGSEAPAQSGAQPSGIPAEALLIVIAVLLAVILALILLVLLRVGKPKRQ